MNVAAAFLIFSMTDIWLYQRLHFVDAGGGGGGGEDACIDYERTENTITVECNASFRNVVGAIDDQSVLEDLGDGGEYLLKANLQVDDDATFSMSANDIKWLKIAGTNGIIVNGKIQIDGVRITSWDPEANSPVSQTSVGTIPRAYINLRGSEGGFVHNSEIAYLGYQEFGRRGFDLFGGDEASHDLEIRGSKFHHMWFAFYSRGAYNITVDGNEFYSNIKYALDPHSGTCDMNITNNWLHHNPIGAICSDRCYNILIEGNVVHHNTDSGIFFSRNMHDSIARNNHVYNSSTGITVSESPGNQIYNNIIHGATSEGVLLFNPGLPDDGFTENNHIYSNIISSSDDGIRATRSHDNILENITFSNIESSEYRLSGNSSIIIRGQDFDNTLIAEAGSADRNFVEIVDSGTIEVNDDDNEDDNEEGNQHNTNDEPYRKRLSDGDAIIVDSQ
jgi:parallel beta-helix repeat protein